MKNIALFKDMIDRYETVAFTDKYIFGFEYKGNIYMTVTDGTVLPFVTCLDKASRGAGYALRFKPTVAQKLALLTGAQILCSKAFFEETVTASKYNSGEIFEKMVTEFFGQVWTKDNVPFTEDGDITVNGIAYQIKFQKASFCNERSLANLKR